MRILDLYAGLGGTARGIQSVLEKKGIDFEYFAIEIDPDVCAAHKINNPKSEVICADVKDWLDKVSNFDFVWASPPCQTHSINNFSNKSMGNKTNPVDWSLWEVIDHLQRTENISYVVENVLIWYNEPFLHNFNLDRHYFWTNLSLIPFKYQKRTEDWGYLSVKGWKEYHQVKHTITNNKRQQLRNCLHWTIAAGIFEQFLEPKQESLTTFLQEAQA